MTKKKLIELIERNGNYYSVKIDASNWVTAVKTGETSHYNVKTNSGGRRCIGTFAEREYDYMQNDEISN